jgi:putative flippase GtrA
MRQYFWFAVAGFSGLAADAGMLQFLLLTTKLGPFWGRAIAILFAMGVTWVINRSRTFSKSRHSLVHEGARYGGVALLSATLNYGLYSAVLLVFPAVPPLIALLFGSACATVFSWVGYSRFVFQK